jgi:branched-chain amino acid transport system ATP-binding protein
LLDEPSLGHAPLMVHQLSEVIRRVNRQGTAVLLAQSDIRRAYLGVGAAGQGH